MEINKGKSGRSKKKMKKGEVNEWKERMRSKNRKDE
jgi:hypothetical protein